MERKRFRVGSIAALFAVVAICVAIFSTLTVVTALSDYRVAQRYGDHVQDIYACQAAGESWLSMADGYLAGKCGLPEGSWAENGQLGTEICSGDMCLTILLAQTGDSYEILQWNCSARWQADDSLELLQ